MATTCSETDLARWAKSYWDRLPLDLADRGTGRYDVAGGLLARSCGVWPPEVQAGQVLALEWDGTRLLSIVDVLPGRQQARLETLEAETADLAAGPLVRFVDVHYRVMTARPWLLLAREAVDIWRHSLWPRRVDLTPQDERQLAVWSALRAMFDHAAYQNVTKGAGPHRDLKAQATLYDRLLVRRQKELRGRA